MAAAGAGPGWILALSQTAARGRRGRAWAMPPGNFAATLLIYPEGTASEAALLSFVAALAVADAIGAPGVTLKWPNDVLLGGGKVAGILLESTGRGRGLAHLAVGIGVNLAVAPPTPEDALPAACLAEPVAPEAFLDRLAPAFARWQGVLDTQGFAPVRAAWLARAARLGAEITARTGATTRTGRFETLGDDGALVLATGTGRERIAAADVFF